MNGNVTLVPALLTALRDIDADRINPERSGARGVEGTASVSAVHGLDGAFGSRALRLARMIG